MLRSDCNRVRTGQSGTPTRSKKVKHYIIARTAAGKTEGRPRHGRVGSRTATQAGAAEGFDPYGDRRARNLYCGTGGGNRPRAGRDQRQARPTAGRRSTVQTVTASVSTAGTAGDGIGAPTLRKEDDRFLRGRGEFVADIGLPGMREIAFLRSPLAHARIRGI